MDDKRTLIAFLLVGVIFLLMPYYYEWMGIEQPRPEPEAVQEARQDSLRVAAEKAADTTQVGAVSGVETDRHGGSAVLETEPAAAAPVLAQPQTATVPSRLITVDTPLQRLQFSTAGGNLVAAPGSSLLRV